MKLKTNQKELHDWSKIIIKEVKLGMRKLALRRGKIPKKIDMLFFLGNFYRKTNFRGARKKSALQCSLCICPYKEKSFAASKAHVGVPPE